MYLFVSFSDDGDEVSLKKAKDYDFDLQGYLDRVQKPVLSGILKSEAKLSTRAINDSIEEYLSEYGYNRTYNKMVKSKRRPEEPWLLIKDTIRKSLCGNNFTVALLKIEENKAFVRNEHKLIKTIRVLELLYLLRKKKPIKQVISFMSSYLGKYKADTLELLTNQGKVVEVELKVRSNDKKITADLLMHDRGTFSFDYMSKRIKQFLISLAMKEIGDKKPEFLASRTALEKLLIHYKLLQKEMEKEGIFPFDRIL